ASGRLAIVIRWNGGGGATFWTITVWWQPIEARTRADPAAKRSARIPESYSGVGVQSGELRRARARAAGGEFLHVEVEEHAGDRNVGGGVGRGGALRPGRAVRRGVPGEAAAALADAEPGIVGGGVGERGVVGLDAAV